jgi:hypothetical protein
MTPPILHPLTGRREGKELILGLAKLTVLAMLEIPKRTPEANRPHPPASGKKDGYGIEVPVAGPIAKCPYFDGEGTPPGRTI